MAAQKKSTLHKEKKFIRKNEVDYPKDFFLKCPQILEPKSLGTNYLLPLFAYANVLERGGSETQFISYYSFKLTSHISQGTTMSILLKWVSKIKEVVSNHVLCLVGKNIHPCILYKVLFTSIQFIFIGEIVAGFELKPTQDNSLLSPYS